MHCSVLQCVAVCCSSLQYVSVRCSVLQCAAVCCSVLQCVAVCCSVLCGYRYKYWVLYDNIYIYILFLYTTNLIAVCNNMYTISYFSTSYLCVGIGIGYSIDNIGNICRTEK